MPNLSRTRVVRVGAGSACLLAFVLWAGCAPKETETADAGTGGASLVESTVVADSVGSFSMEGFRAEIERILRLESMVARHAGMAAAATSVPVEAMAAAMESVMAMEVPFRDLDLPILMLLRWAELAPEPAVRWMADQLQTDRFVLVVDNVFFNWALNDPGRALALAQVHGDRGFRYLAVNASINALERTDPGRARAEADRLADLLGKAPPMDPIALLTRRDPEAAWESLRKEWAGGKKDHRSWQSFFAVLAESDPRRAVSLLDELPDDDLLVGAGMAAYGAWARSDPRAALEATSLFPNPQRVHAVVMRVIEAASESDAAAGLALADSIADPGQRRQAIIRAVRFLDAQNPAPALATIGAMTDTMSRQAAYDQFLPSMAASDPAGTMAWIRTNLSGTVQARSMVAVLAVEAGRDPESAAHRIDEVPPGQYRTNALGQVARTWAEKDPLSAFSWALSLPSEGDRRQAITSLAPIVTRKDVDQAMALVSEMPPGQSRDIFEHQVAMQLALEDPAAALNWAGRIMTPATRSQATGNVLSQWAQRDPETAFLHAVSEPDPNIRANHLMRVASTWANQDPEAAVQTLAAFSDRGVEPHLFSGALSQWIHSDELRASEWLETEAPSGVRDQGLAMLVGARLQHDAPAALADALRIGNPPQRRQALRQILAWSQHFDPDFGRVLLSGNPNLSADERADLQREFGNRLGDG